MLLSFQRIFSFVQVFIYMFVVISTIFDRMEVGSSSFAPLLLFIKKWRTPLIYSAILLTFVAQRLSSTGEFDMYVNDELVFSKHSAGRYPTEEVFVGCGGNV